MKNLIFLILSLALLSSCYTATKTPEEKDTRLENQKSLAVASVRRGNFKQALKDIETAKKIDGGDPEVYLIYGIIYYGLKDYKTAEEYYEKALDKDKKFTEARFNLCGLYLKTDKLDKAIENCTIAASDPLYKARASALTNLGTAYFRKGDVNKAKIYYDKALEINPTYVYTHNELGKLYMSIGKEIEAIQEFKLAINGYPDYEEAHFNLGVAYLKQGNKLSACHSFNKVVSLSPGSKLGVNAKSYINTVCNQSSAYSNYR